MTKILNLIRKAVKAIFCRETISKVWEILFGGAKTTVSEILADKSIMDAAFDYAASLAAGDASSESKRETFNSLMTSFLTAQGKTVGSSVLNVIRETAVAAVKAEAEQAE